MKIQSYVYPKSSFLSIDKDTDQIIDRLMSNENLLRLLYYTSTTPLELTDKQPKLIVPNDEDKMNELWDKILGQKEFYGKQYIRTVPKITVDSPVLNYLVVTFDNFTPNPRNDYYRDNIVTFDIICHFDQWQMQGKYMALRPYRIAGEIDSMFNKTHLSGIGTLNFIGANQLILYDEFGGVSLMYSAIHSDDDTHLNIEDFDPRLSGSEGNSPMEDLSILNFNDMYNKKD